MSKKSEKDYCPFCQAEILDPIVEPTAGNKQQSNLFFAVCCERMGREVNEIVRQHGGTPKKFTGGFDSKRDLRDRRPSGK
jgi:hypothetical protein